MKNTVEFNNLDNTMNDNIYKRNLPSKTLESNFSNIPLGTRYTKYLINNNYNFKLTNEMVYDSETTFFPGTSKPHFSGFSTNVDKESILRNQIYPLMKSDLHLWAPSSSSILYNETENVDKKLDSLLFKKDTFNQFNPNYNNNIGKDLFNNSTRVQLKNL